MSLGDYIAANIDCFLTQWVKGGKAVDGKKSGGGKRRRTDSIKASRFDNMAVDHIKKIIQTGLSALLRAHRPDGLFFLFKGAAEIASKKQGRFLERREAAISGSK